ncbi:MAG: hypothetical protein K0R22_1335 [Sporomusa sp.]|jgi:maleate isomerase|nr:hypothetical protein [Sporomusa sp.]
MIAWKHKIGLLISARNQVIEPDFNQYRPAGVSVHSTRIRKDQDFTNVDTMNTLQASARDAAAVIAQAGVDIAVFGCTAASFLHGGGQDIQLARSLQQAAGIPVITTATAVVTALQALELKRLTIITPYIDELNEREGAFFRNNGFDVKRLKGMDIEQTSKLPGLTPAEIYHFCIKYFDSGSDGLFISCTNIRAMAVIPYLEMHLGKPVITSNQASLWCALRQSGNNDRCEQAGLLLKEH